jgi:hypothetical protein
MIQDAQISNTDLKEALLWLPATGEKGFEGLLGVALPAISSVPFRLAASGSQRGLDGKATYEADSVCFEAKRYDKEPPRNSTIVKVAETALKNVEVDLWVLGSTAKVSTQHADDLRDVGAKDGLSVLILDWMEQGLGPLPVALAMAKDEVSKFLAANIDDAELCGRAVSAISAVKSAAGFDAHAARIKEALTTPSIALALARHRNREWLATCFADRKNARCYFGQPIAPQDAGTSFKARPTLSSKIDKFVKCTSNADEMLAVLGGEGNGKTWAVASSWICDSEFPIMVLVSAEEFSGKRPADFSKLLIDKLIEQTGDVDDAKTRKRWSRRLNSLREWSVRPAWLIFVIDGINQRSGTDWGRHLEAAFGYIEDIGGRLIFTSRTEYFDDNVRRRLGVNVLRLDIPEWNNRERDEILAERNLSGTELRPDAARSLCNPRLLGIALELVERGEIVDISELTVSRLLFEHMRASERDAQEPQPAHAFARNLQDHAEEVLARFTAQQRDDLRVFDALKAVIDGRFFVPLCGDPTRYELADDGLTLALAFSVIDQLRKALRNNRNLDAEIDRTLEPIAALDRTADLMLAALTVAAHDERCEDDIVKALLRAYLGLQNPNQADFKAFSGIARKCILAYMGIARDECLKNSGHASNFDWLQAAIFNASEDEDSWREVGEELRRWFTCYSLEATDEERLYSGNSNKTDRVKEARKRLDDSVAGLSSAERDLLDSMTETAGDVNALTRFAMLLLAGKALTPFAADLTRWAFGAELNGGFSTPSKEFSHLLRLNTIDWASAREAMLKECSRFRIQNTSDVGQWTLKKILYAMGDVNDGQEAEALYKELTKDRELSKGWRLVEDYCETDPCDPESVKPANIDKTAQQYRKLDAATLRQGRGQTSDDSFFVMARPGVTRFVPEGAIEKHLELAADLTNRKGVAHRQALFEMRKHPALLTRELAEQLATSVDDGQKPEEDRWWIAQFRLLLAFPFLSADEQYEALLASPGDHILRDLADVMKPLEELRFEELFEAACEHEDERAQYFLLSFANITDTPCSPKVRQRMKALISSGSDLVRMRTLGIVCDLEDPDLLAEVRDSGWRTPEDEKDREYEAWYGSLALLKAAEGGLIDHADAVDRMSPRLYGRAVRALDESGRYEIASRVGASISCACELEISIAGPDIEMHADFEAPVTFSVSEREKLQPNSMEAFQRAFETDEAFTSRQRRNADAYQDFVDRLTKAKANIILDFLSPEEFRAIAEADPEAAERWYPLFMSLPKAKLVFVYNLVLLLAHAIAKTDPAKAVVLFKRVRNTNSVVRISFRRGAVQLDGAAIWSGPEHEDMDAWRMERLDMAENDEQLSKEVRAALVNEKQALLERYIGHRLESEEPAQIARALMVTGFSDHTGFNDGVLKHFENAGGFIGKAQDAACYAYDRNKWARNWFERMCETGDPKEFWRCSILFGKIVDGRFSLWPKRPQEEWGEPMRLFRESLRNEIENRMKKWNSVRKKKLFGQDVPDPIFIHRD